MIAASSLAYPGSKPLSNWWRQLAPFQPCGFWVGHLLLHRIEALADVLSPHKLDPLARLVLEAVALDHAANHRPSSSANSWLAPLVERLHLEAGVLLRLVHGLQAQGLLDAQPNLTERGLEVVQRGSYFGRNWQRREFVFAERSAHDRPPPQFLPLRGGLGAVWQPDESSRFRLDSLRACLSESTEWKDRFDFPRDVLDIADPAPAADSPPRWQRVVIDRPERLLLVLIASGAERRLLGFAARQEGWELQSRDPVLVLPWSEREVFPDLRSHPSWPSAWHNWCSSRHLPVAECRCDVTDCRLDIQVPAPLHRHLLAGRNDVLKGETWLLAGEGYLRAAAQVHVTPNPDELG